MGEISLDQEQATVTSAHWRDYADRVESHGRTQHVPADSLRSMLGDVYSDYIDAKLGEYDARSSAYQRAAAQARSHADKLDNTRRSFSEGDDAAAANFRALTD